MKVYYDLHMHSCLSPCGDDDMTPNNIVGMSKLCGLDIIALTDHNSCKNCRATIEVGVKNDLCVVPGMEICTSEEIHAVCLFESIEKAEAFDKYIYENVLNIKNRPDIYGNQLILDENDIQTGFEKKLLLTATNISITGLNDLVTNEFDGFCFPAHINRDSYSLISVFGEIPTEENFKVLEIYKPLYNESLNKLYPEINSSKILYNSDAHYLQDISQAENQIELKEISAKALIDSLRNR